MMIKCSSLFLSESYEKENVLGISSLILIIGVVGVYFMLQPDPDQEPEKKFIVPSEADLEQAREARKPPRKAKNGFKWERHDDHWYEKPIAQNDEPQQTPESQKNLFASTWKLNFTDKIPENYPTEAELEQMDIDVLINLSELYTSATNKLRKTDYDAGVRLYNETIPILFKIIKEKMDKVEAISETMTREFRKEFPIPRSYPVTEESPAVYIDTKPTKKALSEEGK